MTTAQQFQQKLARRKKEEEKKLAERLAEEGFTLVREIGKGGEGTAYLLEPKVEGEQQQAGRQQVGKLLEVEDGNEAELERLLHETQVLQHLDHPRITKSGRVVELPELGRIMLTREYIPEEVINETQGKRNLRVLLQEKKVLPEAEVVRVMDSVLEILEYLHDPVQHRAIPNAVVHRDVKPENIFVDEKWNAYVTDFGVARISGTGKTTATAHVRGTHGYAAPEQYGGGGYPQSDLFGLAVTALEMLTGEVPEYFRKGYFQRNEFQLPENLGINSGLKRILEQMVKLEYTERPSSAAEVRRLLREKTKYLNNEMVTESVGERVILGNESVVAQEYSDLEIRIQKLAKERVDAAKDGKETVIVGRATPQKINNYVNSTTAGREFIQLLEQQRYEYHVLSTRRGKFLTSYFTRETADGKVQILIETNGEAVWGRNKAFTGYTYKEAQQGEDIEKLVKRVMANEISHSVTFAALATSSPIWMLSLAPALNNNTVDRVTPFCLLYTAVHESILYFIRKDLPRRHGPATTSQDENGDYKAITTALQPRELLTKKVPSQEVGNSVGVGYSVPSKEVGDSIVRVGYRNKQEVPSQELGDYLGSFYDNPADSKNKINGLIIKENYKDHFYNIINRIGKKNFK